MICARTSDVLASWLAGRGCLVAAAKPLPQLAPDWPVNRSHAANAMSRVVVRSSCVEQVHVLNAWPGLGCRRLRRRRRWPRRLSRSRPSRSRAAATPSSGPQPRCAPPAHAVNSCGARCNAGALPDSSMPHRLSGPEGGSQEPRQAGENVVSFRGCGTDQACALLSTWHADVCLADP